ncbi:MAG: 4Fe-4S dicluster domain-containing protein [Oscillospiraceae bacterium]|jgi:ferredoxin|nr:4Fe-4S dicluster domain-containing protein [Oscillospiraceae bacterium]
MTIFYFTATGNSLDAAKQLGAKFPNAQLRSIPQERDTIGASEDAIGVVFPVFAANIPAIVTRFLRRVNLKANYKFAVAVHGGDPGPIGGVLARISDFDNVFDVETWSNYLPFNPDIPPVATDISGDIEQIAETIRARKTQKFKPDGGEPFDAAPWRLQALDYRWRKDCTACGTCMRVCPVANYTISEDERDENGVPLFKFSARCEGCMACLQNCPAAALHMPNEPTRYRYRNPNVTLSEIIAANEQKF